MDKYYQLTELLLRLIKVQIEKYTGLANIGVGPDAGINGYLVVDEANELLQFAQTLTDLIRQGKEDDALFMSILSQTQFYLQQEHLRGYAGWLIDENNIHNVEYQRLQRYEKDISTILAKSGIEKLPEVAATNDTQRQCEHDSHSIAYKITNLVIELKKNPAMELNGNIVPKHAIQILRRHAQNGGRYDKPEIYNEIERLQQQCDQYLSQSDRQTSTKPLSKEEAAEIRQKHEEQFSNLINKYQESNPSSRLFSEDPDWYEIAGRNHIKPQLAPTVHSQGMFSTKTALLLCAGAIAITMLIYNLLNMSDINSHTLSR